MANSAPVLTTGAPSAGTQNYSLLTLARAGGFTGTAAYEAAAIAFAESSGNPKAEDHDNNGTTDYGLWQINSVHGYDSDELINNPVYNAQAAYAIYKEAGNSFSPWDTYTSGAYAKTTAAQESANNYSVTLQPVGHGSPAVTVWKYLGRTFAGNSGAQATNVAQTDPTPDIDPKIPSVIPAWLDTIGNALTSEEFWEKAGLILLGVGVIITGLVIWVGSDKSVQSAVKIGALA
jgi:hypothetical protein